MTRHNMRSTEGRVAPNMVSAKAGKSTLPMDADDDRRGRKNKLPHGARTVHHGLGLAPRQTRQVLSDGGEGDDEEDVGAVRQAAGSKTRRGEERREFCAGSNCCRRRFSACCYFDISFYPTADALEDKMEKGRGGSRMAASHGSRPESTTSSSRQARSERSSSSAPSERGP